MENKEHTHHVTPEPVIHHRVKGLKKLDTLALPISIIIAGLLIASSIMLSSGDGITSFAGAGLSDGGAKGEVAKADEDLKVLKDDHIIGNKKAGVMIFAWSDPECPFCKRHHETLTNVLKKYEGKVAVVYRHFALDMHEYAKKESESIECSQKVGGEEGFVKYLNKLFETTQGNNSLKRADLTKIAGEVGLDTAKFDACVDSGEMASRVQRDMDAGLRVGVQGTPYSVAVNVKTGKQRVINGAQPLEMISSTLDQLFQ
jgi:protein-disulfide isomerase